MSRNQEKLDELRKILLSLLVARQELTPITLLERDYYKEEQTRIPYRQFGFPDLLSFLQSMPEYFIIEQNNGLHYVRPIASDKSKHVSSLVARQKNNTKSRFLRRPPHMRSQRIKIGADKLFNLIQHVRSNPNGVSMQDALNYVCGLVPHINISPFELREQLREVSHLLYLDSNMIYPVWNNDILPNTTHNTAHRQPSMQQSSMSEPRNQSRTQSESRSSSIHTYAAGQEDSDWIEDFSDEGDFIPANCINNTSNCQRRPTTSEQLAANLAQYSKHEQTNTLTNKTNDNNNNDNMEINVDEYFALMNSKDNAMNINKINTTEHLSQIISDRTKLRLKQLLDKHPKGIWCAELPDLYLQEYKVRLNYTGLGFASVREFTSHLPQIFYMAQGDKTADFILYSADKKLMEPRISQMEPTEILQASNKKYDEHSTMQYVNDDDKAPIPSDVSSTITKRFAPNDVMNYDDDVGKISVTELQNSKTYLEIYISEVFHPCFFWIHLRENKKRFDRLMIELCEFYDHNKDTYTIAKIALKKGLNCACLYSNKWHRGVIKNVKADFKVTIFFYDYGTLKTYAPEEIYYLHKRFSYLPAQAIPCGLYNVKPCIGDRWKRSVIEQFIDKVNDTLLAATIISVDPTYNSMMIILTDTSEDEDVEINQWLVNERLAQVGKMVRMYDLIYYLTSDNVTDHSKFCETLYAEITCDENEPRPCIDQSYDEKMHRLSGVKTEDTKKTVKSLHNVPAKKRALLQMLRSKSSNAESSCIKSSATLNVKLSDAKLYSNNQSQNEKSETPKESISLEKLQTLSFHQKSNSNPSANSNLIFKKDRNNEDDIKQTDSNRKIESQDNNDYNKDYNCYGYMNFRTRDSDDENDENDFGTFRSLYGGRGLMEPFDWSIIKNEHLPHKKSALPNNVDASIKRDKNDVIEDKSELCNQKDEIPGKEFFLHMTRMEMEHFLPENNIKDDAGKMTEVMETLKNQIVPNDTFTIMFTSNIIKKLKMCNNIQSNDALNSSANIVELNNLTSSKGIDQKIDGNKVCETKTHQQIENGNFNMNFNADSNTNSNVDSDANSNTDFSIGSNTNGLELVSSDMPNDKNNINGEMSERNTNNALGFNANNKIHPSYNTLLDKIKQRRMDTTNNLNKRESPNNVQIQSSFHNCSNTTTSSSSQQSKALNIDTRINLHKLIKELESMSKALLKSVPLNESHSDFNRQTLSSSEMNSVAFFNNDNIKCRSNQSSKTYPVPSSDSDDRKEHQSLSQPVEIDSTMLPCNHTINIDDSKLNDTDQTLSVSEIVQKMMKIVQNIANNTELDSDDLSSYQESIKNNTSDESNRDDKSVKSVDSYNLSSNQESKDDRSNENKRDDNSIKSMDNDDLSFNLENIENDKSDEFNSSDESKEDDKLVKSMNNDNLSFNQESIKNDKSDENKRDNKSIKSVDLNNDLNYNQESIQINKSNENKEDDRLINSMDSDDWSCNQESVKNGKSDESKNDRSVSSMDSDDLSFTEKNIKNDKSKGDKKSVKLIKSDCLFETNESTNDTNMTEVIYSPVYNDCDIDSDDNIKLDNCDIDSDDSTEFNYSRWDSYASEKDIQLFNSFYNARNTAQTLQM